MKKGFLLVSLLAVLLAFSSCDRPEGDVSGSVSDSAVSENASAEASGEISEGTSEEMSDEMSEEVSDDGSKEYSVIEATRSGDVAVAVKMVRGKKHYALVCGEELVCGFDYDKYSALSSGYIILKNSSTDKAMLFTSDGRSVDRAYREVAGGFELGIFHAVKKTDGGSVRYALLMGGEVIGPSAMLDGEIVTDFTYTSIEVLKYTDDYGEEVGAKFMLLEKADGSSEIRNSKGKLLVSGTFSEAVPMYGMLAVKEGDKYVLYDGSGRKTGLPEFTDAKVTTLMKYRVVRTYSQSGDEHYSAMKTDEDGVLVAEDYDAGTVSERYYNELIGVASRLVKAVLEDDFDALKELCQDEEIVSRYKTALDEGDYDRQSHDTVSGLLNIKKNYYGFDGAVKGFVAPGDYIFADEDNGYFEIVFFFPLYDELHPVTNLETMSFVSDGKGGFRVEAVGNQCFTGVRTINFITDSK